MRKPYSLEMHTVVALNRGTLNNGHQKILVLIQGTPKLGPLLLGGHHICVVFGLCRDLQNFQRAESQLSLG